MQVALVGVSHWHYPLYESAILQSGVKVVGVSDPDQSTAQKVAQRHEAPVYANCHQLLDAQDVDFAFAFGIHSEMPDVARALIQRNIAFSIEKPCGVTLEDVAEIRALAHERGTFVSIPFVYRVSPVFRFIESMEKKIPADVAHLSIRNIAGSPYRYVSAGVPWMLEKDRSGGGCLINLAVHFIDLAYHLTKSEPRLLRAQVSNKMYGETVEDYALVVTKMASGAIATVETGYTFPNSSDDKREFSLTYSSKDVYVQTTENGLKAFPRQEIAREAIMGDVELDTDFYYNTYVTETLDRFSRQEEPIANMDDMYRVMDIVQQAYRCNETG